MTSPPPVLSEPKPGVALVGSGAVGTALALRLTASGFPVCAVVSRTEAAARALAGRVGAPAASSSLYDLPEAARLVFCCVPDDRIDEVAYRMAGLPRAWTGTAVVHTSGALPASALAPVAGRGALVLSFHPVQSFRAGGGAEAFDGIFVGLEGEAAAVAYGADLAVALGIRSVAIPTAAKTRYHLAATIASNFFVALMGLTGEVLADAGLDRSTASALVRPLVETTWRNLAGRLPEDVLTGPVVRGDLGTVTRHTEALTAHLPHLLPVYTALSTEAVRIAVRGGRLDPDDAERLLEALYAALEPDEDPLY